MKRSGDKYIPHRYVQPAVNRQPGYRWGDSQSKLTAKQMQYKLNPKENQSKTNQNTTFSNIESHMTNFVLAQLRVKCSPGHAPLHVASLYYHLGWIKNSCKSYRRQANISTMITKKEYKCSGATRRQTICATSGKPSTWLPPGDS